MNPDSMAIPNSGIALSRAGVDFFVAAESGIIAGLVMARLAHGSDLIGSSLRIGDLTLGAAKVAAHVGVASVRARTASAEAVRFLEAVNIGVFARSIGCPAHGGGLGVVDELNSEVDDLGGVLRRLEANLIANASWFALPSDRQVGRSPGLRQGLGGGGT